MPKFQPIVSSLLVAYVSATGCYPAYSPGNVASYAAGTSVSQVVTVTTPITWTACEVSTICITGWEQTGGITTTSAHNFVCSSDVWCSNVGYAPGGEHTDLAWTKEDAECSGTAVVTPPTTSPTVATTLAPTPEVWSGTGCPKTFVVGAPVALGDSRTVTKDGASMVYTCNDDTTGGWCNMEGYQPGMGRAWKMAWTLMGSCTGTLTPTSSPTTLAPTASPSSSLPNQGGCPSVWTTGVSYREGDLVSKNEMVYQCNGYPMSLFCPMDAYAPLLVSGAWKLAWSTVGPCTGTIPPVTASPTTALPTSSPSSSPTVYSGTCTYDKIVVTAGPSVPCVHGSSTSCICTAVDVSVDPLGYTCTMLSTVTTTTPTPVIPWSDSITYAAGDVVRVGVNRFKCKESPFTGWCSVTAYAPAVSGSVPWTDAWTLDGTCQ